MKNKKLFVILISSILAVVAIVSVFMLFTVKDVNARYNVAEGSVNCDGVKETLDVYVGSNLLFLNLDEIKEAVEANPYIEVLSIDKKFPNEIELSVRERREIFVFECAGKYYVANEKGFVLREISDEEFVALKSSREHITLICDNIVINDAVVGEYVYSSDSDRLRTAFLLAENAELTDCIDEMTVSKKEATSSVPGIKQTVVVFSTYTGVEIEIWDAGNYGDLKVDKAFEIYDSETSDYIKTHEKIIVFVDQNNNILAEWVK